MDKYLEAEKRLAELLGYGKSESKWQGEPVYRTLHGWKMANWTRDNAAAFALMVEHELIVDVDHDNERCVVTAFPLDHPRKRIEARYADHPDKETAVRYAIVQAVIAKLEGANS